MVGAAVAAVAVVEVGATIEIHTAGKEGRGISAERGGNFSSGSKEGQVGGLQGGDMGDRWTVQWVLVVYAWPRYWNGEVTVSLLGESEGFL